MAQTGSKGRTKFRATLTLSGKTATGITVPEEAVAELDAGKRVKVRATINGYTYRSSVAPWGGDFMLPVSAEHRQGAGINPGDEVEVELEVDTEPREVTVPPDLAAALDTDPEAKQIFSALAFSHRQQYVVWIEGAKAAETRQRRVDKTLEMLKAGS